jgi:hypothetical protein
MCHSLSSRTSYNVIRVMFWAFPSLLWQAFGHWSGFVVGVMVALILTAMFKNLTRQNTWNKASGARQHFSRLAEPQSPSQEEEKVYQRGYRVEVERYHIEPYVYRREELQPQYEEMQVPYPQETMPPMRRSESEPEK